MRKIIGLVLTLTLTWFLSGCAKLVQVPVVQCPDVSPQLKVVADSNIDPAQKPLMMKDIIEIGKQECQMLLDRAGAKGANMKDIVLAVIATASALATPFVVAFTK